MVSYTLMHMVHYEAYLRAIKRPSPTATVAPLPPPLHSHCHTTILASNIDYRVTASQIYGSVYGTSS